MGRSYTDMFVSPTRPSDIYKEISDLIKSDVFHTLFFFISQIFGRDIPRRLVALRKMGGWKDVLGNGLPRNAGCQEENEKR